MLQLDPLRAVEPRRPRGVWRNRVWLPSRLPMNPRLGVWGPGVLVAPNPWPSEDVAETKAAVWLATYEQAGWVQRYGRAIYLGAVFFPE